MINIETITNELDRLYEFEIEKYISECDDLKKMGYKIYRNPAGKHKVVAPQSQANRYDSYGQPINDLNTMFGGIFGDIFGGSND